MSHDAHEGYSPHQILKDGCEECGRRAGAIGRAISHLDPDSFAHAWRRAARMGQLGLADMSQAECGLLDALWAVQIQLQRHGLPIGLLPLPYVPEGRPL